MRTSEKIDEIAPALLQTQADVPDPPRTGVNPHFGSDYATLDDIIHAARPVLIENDITLVQAPGMNGDGVTVETRLIHMSGQWISSTASSPVQKADPQGVGATVTYLRRYGLASMLGLAHEEDDDANRAVRRDDGDRELEGEATDAQTKFIRGLLSKRQVPDKVRENLERALEAGTLTKQRASDAIEYLQDRPEQGGGGDDLAVENGKATASFDCPECEATVQPGMRACDDCGWLIEGPPEDEEES